MRSTQFHDVDTTDHNQEPETEYRNYSCQVREDDPTPEPTEEELFEDEEIEDLDDEDYDDIEDDIEEEEGID